MAWTLYTAARSRGFMCEWLLEEIGRGYDVVRLDLQAGEARTAAYRAIHPLGAVPALVVDGRAMVESLAICLFLADAASDLGLAPGPAHPDRASYLQWMVYASATLEPKLSAPFVRSLSANEGDRPGVATVAEREAFEAVLGPLAQRMGRGHLLPAGFSAADVLVGSQLYWASQVGLLAQAEKARGYLATMMARPACRRALQHDLG